MRKNEDLALWCAYLLAFFGLLRKKNVVPEGSGFDPSKVLLRRNFSLDLSSNIVYLYVGLVKRTNSAQEILFYQYLGTRTQHWTQCVILLSSLIGFTPNPHHQPSLIPVEGA